MMEKAKKLVDQLLVSFLKWTQDTKLHSTQNYGIESLLLLPKVNTMG